MRKKNIIGFLLAFVMLLSICTSSFAVYAEESRYAEEPAVENKVASAEVVGEEKEIDAEKPEDPQEEEIVKEPVEPEKKVEKVQELKKAKELKAQDSEDAIELGEEKVPEAVGAPAGFDLSTINTLAKDAEGNCYAVKDYGNTYDNVLTKYFYKIDEADYNILSQSFLMTFKRKDGQPFKVYDARMGDGDINDKTPNYYGKPEAEFIEMQLRDNMVYDTTIAGNYSPMSVTGQENLTWSIELNKDWDIKATPGFTDGSSTRSIYMFYDVELDGKGHKIHRADNKNEIILQLGSGYNGSGAQVRTASLKNLIIDGDEEYNCIKVYDKGVLNLENVQIIKGNSNQANDGAGITLGPEGKLDMDAKSSITDCFAERGGAINAWEKTIININGSNISNNLADLGGAVCSLDKDSTINIKDATFDNNQAILLPQGGYGYGGAIYTKSNLSIENSTFTNNFAQAYGGAIYHKSASKFDIKASNFKNNGILNIPQGIFFTKNGGAIYAANKVNISDNCNFEGNIADYGGALITVTEADISKSTFKENQANSGGAIYSFDNLKIMDDSLFEGNQANNGGAIYANNLNVEKTDFKNNTAYKSGGGVYAKKPANINLSKFIENKAQWGGAFYDNGNSSFNDVTFEKNTAMHYGAGIVTTKGINVTDSKFIENTNMQGTKFQGAGIYIDKNAPKLTKVTNTLFEKNSAPSGGAGIFVGNNSKLEVDNSRFIQNDAARGAGISSAATGNVDTSLSNIKVESSTFTENLSYMGAGIFTAFPTEINKCTFIRNKAVLQPGDDEKNPHDYGVGGALEVMDNNTTIKASTFEENYAYGSGGAIGISGVARDKTGKITNIKQNIKVEISDNTKFIKNICNMGQGGAIFTIPYLYDIGEQQSDVDAETLKAAAYSKLTTADDTIFKDNFALSGFVDPPENYADYANLAFARNSFTEKLPNQIVAKSLLNNYDVNYKNAKLNAFFDPNGGEFAEGANPKDIRVLTDKKDAEITLLDAPKRDGYKFLGWKCSMNIPDDILKELPKELIEKLNEGKIFKAGDKFKLDADYIFLAQWEKDDTPTPPPTPEPKPEPKPEPEVEPRRHEYVDTISVIAKVPDKESYLHMSYLFGYPDKTIRPEGNMTRAEALAVVTRLEGYSFKDDSAKVFKDMKKGAWYNKYINAAFEHGILVEKEGEDFRPDQAITRAEFAKLISFIDKDNSKVAPFADVKGHVYEDAINKAYGNDRIKGYPDGTFRPDAKITRAEIVTILNNFYDRKADSESLKNVENIENLKHFKDLSEGYWAYYEITEAANSHEYVRRSGGLVENWIRLLEDLVK